MHFKHRLPYLLIDLLISLDLFMLEHNFVLSCSSINCPKSRGILDPIA